MLLAHGTVVVLADGEKLELYRNTGNEADPKLSPLPAPELDVHNRGAGMHHRSSTANPSSSLDEDAHAAAVADWLNGEVLAHKIDDLVVIAPPRTLGELRKHFHKQTEQIVRVELAKDLLGRPAPDVIEALRAK